MPQYMYRLYYIIAIGFLSCGQQTVKEPGTKPSKQTDIIKQHPHETVQIKDAFHWTWSKPTDIIVLPASVTKFVATEQVPIDTSSGDLNEDGMDDLIVVTARPKEDSLQYTGQALPRHLLVFLGRAQGGYTFGFRNEKVIPCIGCCGMTDPYAGICVKRGQLIINEYCASNLKAISEYRFRYAPRLRDWLLDTVVTERYAFSYEQYQLDTETNNDFGKVSLKTLVMCEVER